MFWDFKSSDLLWTGNRIVPASWLWRCNHRWHSDFQPPEVPAWSAARCYGHVGKDKPPSHMREHRGKEAVPERPPAWGTRHVCWPISPRTNTFQTWDLPPSPTPISPPSSPALRFRILASATATASPAPMWVALRSSMATSRHFHCVLPRNVHIWREHLKMTCGWLWLCLCLLFWFCT